MIPPSQHAARFPAPRIRRRAAFSLVEIAIAMGIIGSLITVITGLVATGLTVFHQSSDRMISAQISQALLSEVSRSDWSSLVDPSSGTTTSFPVSYFNESGEKVALAGAAIYIARPVLFSPTSETLGGSDYSTMGAARIVRVVVEVMCRPGGSEPPISSAGLWNPAQKDRLKCYSSYLVRNR